MTDKTIMESLHNYLPKNLVNIVEEYSKDRTNHDKVMYQLHECINNYVTNKHLFDIIHLSFATYMSRLVHRIHPKRTKKIGADNIKRQRQRNMKEFRRRFLNT